MKNKLVISCLSALLAGSLFACSSPNQSTTYKYDSMFVDGKQYDLEFSYRDDIFLETTTFSKDLAMLMYGLSLASGNKSSIQSFYTDLGYEEQYYSPSYDSTPTIDSIGYSFALNSFKENKVISITIRGMNYGKEWINDFELGEEGNHAGFNQAANEVYNSLQTYVDNLEIETDNLYFTLTGYSRGGAVANVLARKMLQNWSLVTVNNLYAYTFEAPRGLCLDEVVAYENVFNIINSADIVTYFAPMEYGLYRCGIDIDIYNEDIDNLIKDFDDEIEMGEFRAEPDKYEKETDLPGYLIHELLNYTGEGEYGKYEVNTRSEFVNNLQPLIQYILNLVFSLKDTTIAAIKEDIAGKSAIDMFIILTGDDGIYNYLHPFLIEDGLEFDDDEFRTRSNEIRYVAFGCAGSILSVYATGGTTLPRMIHMHYPEINYLLLKAYQN